MFGNTKYLNVKVDRKIYTRIYVQLLTKLKYMRYTVFILPCLSTSRTYKRISCCQLFDALTSYSRCIST